VSAFTAPQQTRSRQAAVCCLEASRFVHLIAPNVIILWLTTCDMLVYMSCVKREQLARCAVVSTILQFISRCNS